MELRLTSPATSLILPQNRTYRKGCIKLCAVLAVFQVNWGWYTGRQPPSKLIRISFLNTQRVEDISSPWLTFHNLLNRRIILMAMSAELRPPLLISFPSTARDRSHLCHGNRNAEKWVWNPIPPFSEILAGNCKTQ